MIELPKDARATINDLARDLTTQWLNGVVPEDGIEAMTPELRTLLGSDDASFDDFQHRDYVRPDWGFGTYHLERFFDAPWQFYVPTSWYLQESEDGTSATAYTAEDKRALAIQATHRDRFPADLEWVFGAGDVLGFEYNRDSADALHWRFVTHGEHGYNVFGIYTMTEYGVLTVGFASNADELKMQLESAMTSIPWYSWLPEA
jgi:hypothetical protein